MYKSSGLLTTLMFSTKLDFLGLLLYICDRKTVPWNMVQQGLKEVRSLTTL